MSEFPDFEVQVKCRTFIRLGCEGCPANGAGHLEVYDLFGMPALTNPGMTQIHANGIPVAIEERVVPTINDIQAGPANTKMIAYGSFRATECSMPCKGKRAIFRQATQSLIHAAVEADMNVVAFTNEFREE